MTGRNTEQVEWKRKMTALKGTEKQIAWAEEIRETVISTMKEMHSAFVNDARFDANNAQHVAMAAKFEKQINLAETENRAWFFIETFGRTLRKSDDSAKRFQQIQAAIKVSVDTNEWK